VPKPRKPDNVSLPPNLYESGGYYAWRHPRTGKRYGLGRDRGEAIAQATEANESLLPTRLVDKLAPPARILRDFLPTYEGVLDRKRLAERTRYNRKRQLTAIGKGLGDVLITARTEDAAEITRRSSLFLQAYVDTGKLRMAKSLRSTLVDLYSAMASAGWLAINPARVIDLDPPVVRRARLTLDTFKRIYEAAAAFDPWVQRSMELALVTLQRREDVALMAVRDVQAGRLLVTQSKTDVRLRIPLALRLDALGWSLADVIGQCRDDVLSRRLLHHTRHQGRAKPGDGVHQQTLTTAFAAARVAAGIAIDEGKTPPTFHELRSLGIRLYKQQGYDPQALAGHKQASTTAVYLDDRGAEWVDVAA
jgi:hypothetical protein